MSRQKVLGLDCFVVDLTSGPMTRSKKQKSVELQALHRTNSQIGESLSLKVAGTRRRNASPCTATLSLGRSQTAVRARLCSATSSCKKKATSVDRRYITLDLVRKLNDYSTVFDKSPMGTGKSHAIKILFLPVVEFSNHIRKS